MNTSEYLKYPHNEILPVISKKEFTTRKLITLKNLYANQAEVNRGLVLHKAKGKNLTDLYVVDLNGKQILLDGHHTVIGLMVAGRTKRYANYLKIDK